LLKFRCDRPDDGTTAKKNQLVTYDALGNVKTKSDASTTGGAATYNYDADGKLITVGTVAVFHDGQGNVLSHGTRSFTYTALDKVRTAASGATSLDFTYDAAGNRARRTAGAAQTISVGSLFERELSGAASTSLTYHVMAGGVPVARVERIKNGNAWTTNTYAMHGDALGSTGVLSNGGGGVYRRLSHDAWGAARRANDWSVAATDAETTAVGLGFTGHRARLDIALIDMRGRMYDPRLARFTSADPLLVDPADPQAWNRYSYVGNRPLLFTDPSGWARDPYIDQQVVDDPDGFGVDGAGIVGGELYAQITIVYSDGVSPAVGWRDTGGGQHGLGPTPEVGVHARDIGNGWLRVWMKGIGTEYMHVSGFKMKEDSIREYRANYYKHLYAPQKNEILENLAALGDVVDTATHHGLMVADLHPLGRAVNFGINLGDALSSDEPQAFFDLVMSGVPGVGTLGNLPLPDRGLGSVPKSGRDGKRLFSPAERTAQREAQGGVCATGCGTKIDASNSRVIM
jgi:RHS repeat-associated protein